MGRSTELEMQKRQHKHEIELARLRIAEAGIKMMGDDPDMKYYLGVLGGAASASFATLLKTIEEKAQEEEEMPINTKPFKDRLYYWLTTPNTNLSLGDWQVIEEQKTSDIVTWMQAGGVSFSMWCATILMIRARYGGEGGSPVI